MLRAIKSLVVVCMMIASCVHAMPGKDPIRVALDDYPGVNMLPTLIAIERTKAKGVDIQVSYMLSEGLAVRAILNKQADIGMGTPYQTIQEINAPIRMFYQLNRLRFHPVVDTRHYSDWRELNGAVMYSHGEGSGTEALVNILAKKNGIQYSRMIYMPGSGVRADAMMNGRIHATVVDTERKNNLLALPDSPFKVLPMKSINASDEALYAHTEFLESHEAELKILVGELLYVWRSMNSNPDFVLEQRNQYGLLPKLSAESISKFYQEMVAEGAFSEKGGRNTAFTSDLEFYGCAGTIQQPELQESKQYWDFTILDQVNDPQATM